MASGPWDNVSLASPPNSPAYLQAFAQLMNSMGNNVNNAFNQYQQGQNFQNQQQMAQYQLQQAQQQQQLRNLFQNGVPTLPNGNPDYSQMIQSMIKVGGAPVAEQLMPALLQGQANSNAANIYNGGQPAQTTTPTATYGILGPRPGGSDEQRISYRQPNDTSEGETVESLIPGVADGRYVSPNTATNVARALQVSPNTTLTPEQDRRARTLIADSIKRQNRDTSTTGNAPNRNPVPQSGNGDQQGDHQRRAAAGNEINPSMGEGNSPQTPRQTGERRIQQTAQAPQQPALAQPQLPMPGSANQRVDQSFGQTGAYGPPSQQKIDAYEARAERAFQAAKQYGLSKEQSETYKDQGNKDRDTANQLRKEREEYYKTFANPSQNPQLQRTLEADKSVGGAVGKRQGEVVEAGGIAARHTINTIDEMQDAFRRSAGKMTEGPYAEQSLKFKQAANNIFPGMFDQNAIVDATAITKLNAQLAAEAAKAMTARPSQLEFRAFMQNNPGLVTGVDGGLFLSEVIKRAKLQDVKLSNLAAKTPADQWPAVEEKFFNDPKNQLFTEAERKNPYLVIGQKGPSPTTQPKVQPGGWQEIAPGIRIRPKPNPADQT